MSANKKGNNHAIVLGTLDFLYLFTSLVLINPYFYSDSQSGAITGGYAASAIVYAFGIIFPFCSRLIKGDIPDNKLLRIADIAALVLAIFSFCGILIYFIWHAGNWVAWLSYVMAGLTSGPSFFSIILAAREYINK